MPIKALKPYARCARHRNKRAIEKLKKIIGYYGQLVPIVVDPNRVIVDGHAVWQSDPEIKALGLALNRIP